MNMALEQAIEHAEDTAMSAIGCECREEHRQLAEWLRELQERRKQPEIIRCKDCKHWKDSDGVYRRGFDAESKCPINIHEVYEGTFYCGFAERRTDENKVCNNMQ